MPFTRNVSNAQELAAALASADGGDTIMLASGRYGALDLSGVSFDSNVTISAATPHAAQFSSVTLSDVDHLTFDGVAVSGEFRAWKGSEHITLVRSDVDGGGYFRDASDLFLKNNHITGGMNALMLNDVDRADVVANVVHDARSDLLRVTGDSDAVRIADNHLLDAHAVAGDHPDMMQVISYDGQTPSDLRIVRNVLYDDPATGDTPAQGVFISKPGPGGYHDVLVADNLVNVASANGVYVNGGAENVLVTGNVLPTWPNGGGGSIRVVEKSGVTNGGTTVDHNFVRQLLDETTSLSDGLEIARTTYKSVPMADILSNWDAHVDASFANVPHALTMDDLAA